jgi:hypothetical protein
MNASGWLLRRSGWPINGAGCSTVRSWTQVRLPTCSVIGAGWPMRHSGRLPISRREHPGAFMEDPAARMAHPGCASDHPDRRMGRPVQTGRLGEEETGSFSLSKSRSLRVSKSRPKDTLQVFSK